jgi:hypothetical protein
MKNKLKQMISTYLAQIVTAVEMVAISVLLVFSMLFAAGVVHILEIIFNHKK